LSLLVLLEHPQVGRRLSISAGGKIAVVGEVIGLAADEDVVIVLRADVLDPDRFLGA
jgi:hypothetical protein